jgi:hypothetical protein
MLDKAVLAAAVALIVGLGERPAYAYIDPGTGSLIYQTALTVALGVAWMLRRSRASISRFVKRIVGRGIAGERATDSRD